MSPETKAAIDALPHGELRLEIEKGRRSRFQGDKYAYAKARLAEIEDAQVSAAADQEHALLERANQIAKDANRIAEDANNGAATANRIAIAGVIVAIVAVVISIVF